jgi:hypothetical protein
MAIKKVFVSCDYDNDRYYKSLLLAWDKNSDFDFNMSNQTADISMSFTYSSTKSDIELSK